MVEQLICNQQVGGSSPSTGSNQTELNMGEFPSGQRGQTVNLLRIASMVRIRPPPPENDKFRKKLVVFSYIRLRRVILLRSDIRLTPSDMPAGVRGEYNITETAGFNITFCRSKIYHSVEDGISLKTNNFVSV